MGIKISKTAIIALVFIFLMLGSTVAYSILQSFRSTGYTIKLPEKNIINYELDVATENYLLERGVTIVKFYYIQACLEECSRQKSSIESIANRYSNQIILEEILSSKTTGKFPNVIISSYRGQKILENATDEEIVNAFCDIMVFPPPTCVAKKV